MNESIKGAPQFHDSGLSVPYDLVGIRGVQTCAPQNFISDIGIMERPTLEQLYKGVSEDKLKAYKRALDTATKVSELDAQRLVQQIEDRSLPQFFIAKAIGDQGTDIQVPVFVLTDFA